MKHSKFKIWMLKMELRRLRRRRVEYENYLRKTVKDIDELENIFNHLDLLKVDINGEN
jgi:muconolactone delta-isomerase